MAKKIKYSCEAIVIGREFIKARDEVEFNGKKYPAKPKQYKLWVVIGNGDKDNPEILKGEPSLVSAPVSCEVYKTFSEPVNTTAVIEQMGGISGFAKVVSLDGFDLLYTDKEDDEE